MATLDDSPSLYLGETWDVWDEAVNQKEKNGLGCVSECVDHQMTDSMKLQRQDMNLFGFCPSQDEFFLVVCDDCGQVVKPQALQAHIETRHRYSIPKFSPLTTTAASQKSPPASSSTPTRSSTPSSKSSSSGKGPPSEENVSKARTLDTKAIARSRTSPAKSRKSIRDLKLKKSQTLPVVKVERIPSPLDGVVSINSDKFKASSPQPISPLRHSPKSPLAQPSPVVHESPAPSPLATVRSPLNRGSPVVRASPHTVASPLVRDMDDAIVASVRDVRLDNDVGQRKTVASPVSPPSLNVSAKAKTPPPPRLPPPSSPAAAVVASPSPVTMTSLLTARVTSPLNASSSDVSDVASLTSPLMTARPDPRTVTVPKQTRLLANLPKQEKLLPCKDREYDPDKHCGVWIADIQKHCTRSLTCKTHALSLRRAVLGRSNSFDQLLDDHRTAKEKILRARAEANGLPFVPSKAATKSAIRKAENERRMPKLNGVAVGQSLSDRTSAYAVPSSLSSPLSVCTSFPAGIPNAVSPTNKLLQKATKLAANNKLHKPLFSPTITSLPGKESTPPPELSSRLSSDGEDETGPQPASGLSYIKFHPRPAATCRFGARLSGNALVFNRKQDLLRSAFSQAVERHLHPPPHKKLCVESKLPREPTTTHDSKDPYEFIFVNSPHGRVSVMTTTTSSSASLNTSSNFSSAAAVAAAAAAAAATNATNAAAVNVSNVTNVAHVPTAASVNVSTPTVASSVSVPPSVSVAVTMPTMNATSLLQQNHVATLLPSKLLLQKSALNRKPLVNRTIKPKDAAQPLIQKRRRSGNSPQPTVTIAPSPNSQSISLSIPNTLTVNLGSMGSLNTTNLADRKNNVMVDPGLNGQFLSFSSVAELQNNIHLKNSERRKQVKSKSVLSNNSILTCLPSGTFVVENKGQLGGQMVLQQHGAAIGPGQATNSPQHARPSPTASPIVHSGTISPQVAMTTSPLSNGVVPSPSSLKNLTYTINAAANPSPASVNSPSPSMVGSAGEDVSPIHHNLTVKPRPHKPNSRPPGTVAQLVQNAPHNAAASQPPRIISALPSTIYPSQIVARSKVALPPNALTPNALAPNVQQKRAKLNVALPFVPSPAMTSPETEPPLKRARPDVRLHQNSPSNFISQQH